MPTKQNLYLEIPHPVEGHGHYELLCGDHRPFLILSCQLNFNSQNVGMHGELLLSFSICSDNNTTTLKKNEKSAYKPIL